MGKATRSVVVKDLIVKISFMTDDNGTETLDKDTTMSEIFDVVYGRAEEILQDREAIVDAVSAYRLAHGANGIPASTVPKGPLVMHLHNELGSVAPGATQDKYARNAAKIADTLGEIAFSAGRSGLQFLGAEEVAAKRLEKQERRAANKRAKLAKVEADLRAKLGL